MKMDFKFLAIAATALSIGFTSCSSDDDGDDNGIVPNGEKTFASIKLVQKSPGTYALPGAGVDPATVAEAAVLDATLYVFDASQTLEQTVSFAAGTTEKELQTTTGTHYFYIAVNTTNVAMPTFAAGTPLTTVQKSVLAGINKAELALLTDATQTTGFFMTSVGAPASLNLQPGIGAGTAPGSVNEVTLNIGRGMAKFNTEFPAATPVIGGTLTTVKYLIANNTQKMFFFPVPSGNAFLSPDYDAYNTTTAPAAGVYWPDLAAATAADFVAPADATTPIYGTENTNAVPVYGNATLLVVEGVYTPTSALDENDGNAAAGVVAANFWRIQKADKSFFPAVYSADPSTGTALATAQVTDPAATVVLYTGGKVYYSLPVQDASKSAPEKYDILRNYYYAITITNVTGPGSNTPGGVIPTPLTPLDVETYMHAKINILPWTVVSQSGGLTGQ